MNEQSPYLTPAEAASLLRKTRRTIYNWVRSGELKAVKAGSTWLINRKAVDDFLMVPSSSDVSPALGILTNSSSPPAGGNPLGNRKKKNRR